MSKKIEPGEDRTLAILNVGGQLETVCAPTIPLLRKILKDYPASSLVEVWRGHRLALKKETKVSF